MHGGLLWLKYRIITYQLVSDYDKRGSDDLKF